MVKPGLLAGPRSGWCRSLLPILKGGHPARAEARVPLAEDHPMRARRASAFAGGRCIAMFAYCYQINPDLSMA